jgi:predicted adenine nucleotide alpha hydrolase (AANH) superfamily ATPase
MESLTGNNIHPVLFYFNPNIFPKKEYESRRDEIVKYADKIGLRIIVCKYDHEEWLDKINGLEDEPERGKRCKACFLFRLSETAKYADKNGFDAVATTLGASRWKNLQQITESGIQAVSHHQLTFLDRNWRKDGLSIRRNELLRQNGFYNQTYCGCEFSMR